MKANNMLYIETTPLYIPLSSFKIEVVNQNYFNMHRCTPIVDYYGPNFKNSPRVSVLSVFIPGGHILSLIDTH